MGDCTSTLQPQTDGKPTSVEAIAARDWHFSMLKEFGVDSAEKIQAEMVQQKDPQQLVLYLLSATIHVQKLIEIGSILATAQSSSKNQLVKCQGSVIDLQKQLLDAKQDLIVSKDEQLNKLTASVEAKVVEVKEEVRGYSAALQSGMTDSGGSASAISAVDVKTAVKTAMIDRADEMNREANVVIFGLVEEEGEKVGEKISELFRSLGEKPKFEAKRVGVVTSGQTSVRPVKVVMRSGVIARQIIGKAAKLRDLEQYKDVYVSADRTPAQRDARRVLVTELKRRKSEEPLKSHYIRGGIVVTVK